MEPSSARRCVGLRAAFGSSVGASFPRARHTRQSSCAIMRLSSQSSDVVTNISSTKRGSAQP